MTDHCIRTQSESLPLWHFVAKTDQNGTALSDTQELNEFRLVETEPHNRLRKLLIEEKRQQTEHSIEIMKTKIQKEVQEQNVSVDEEFLTKLLNRKKKRKTRLEKQKQKKKIKTKHKTETYIQ